MVHLSPRLEGAFPLHGAPGIPGSALTSPGLRGGRDSDGVARPQTEWSEPHAAAEAPAPPNASHEERREPDTTQDERPVCALAANETNCATAKCCHAPGHQCYAKDEFWGECMVDCTPGPNLFDVGSSAPWSCKPLGARAPVHPERCAAAGENCLATGCCQGPGQRCYAKNATFGACRASCQPGVDMTDDDWRPWSCRAVGPLSKPLASWVPERCAWGGASCAQSHCCAEAGHRCYLKDPWYGHCMRSCVPGPGSECRPVGARTPESTADRRTVGPWVEGRCSKGWENCQDSACCAAVGHTCFRKDGAYAACMPKCDPSLPDPKDNKTWSCAPMGPKSFGLATKGYPSLYCLSLYMPSRYEGPLLRSVLARRAGIFACDGYELFAAEDDMLGAAEGGSQVQPVLIPKIAVGVSQDGTAGNAQLFMAVWDKVVALGRFRYYDFTIKVDPDAVLLPWRLRGHIAAHVGSTAYVVNCNKFPGSPNFPMMYGAVEIFSRMAIERYGAGSGRCAAELPWQPWGEDYYMTHCMDHLGVARIEDFGALGDNMCLGARCSDGGVATFHPFKTQESWHRCWDIAVGGPAPQGDAPPSMTIRKLAPKSS